MKTLAESTGRARGELYKKERRGDLLAAADRAIRRTGPHTSMDDIAGEAGISRVVLYRYFGDKAGLYAALAEHYSGQLLGHLQRALTQTDDAVLRLERTITTYVDFIEDNAELYDFLMHRAVKEGPDAQATVSDFMRAVASQVGEILSSEITTLGLDPSPARIWANGVVGMVHLSTDWWLQTKEVSKQRFVGYLVGLLSWGFFGLATNAESARQSGLESLDPGGTKG